MKKILIVCSMLISIAYAQCDTVTNLTISNLTFSSGRANFTPPAQPVSTYSWNIYTYPGNVFTGVQGTGPSTVVNFTGLNASTQYKFRVATICVSTGTSTQASKIFTTAANAIVYTPESPREITYLLVDTLLSFKAGDTVLKRGPTGLPAIVYKSSNNTFYGYYPNCTCFKPLAIDSAGIIALLNNKVDSVTLSGNIIYYWKLGVAYGFTLPGITTGKLAYVDAVNGNDGTGAIGNASTPFLTLSAAKTAATAGCTIVVRPGSYSVSASIAKDSVDWFFYPGATVTLASDITGVGIWDDGGNQMSFTVTGEGKFIRSTTDDALAIFLININNASSNVYISANELTINGGDDGVCALVKQSDGALSVNAPTMIATGGFTYGIWWLNGAMSVNANKLITEYAGIASEVSTTPTGNCYINIKEIQGDALSFNVPPAAIDTVAAIWINASTIKGVVQSQGGNKVYITTQKIFNRVKADVGAGLVYINTDKITDVGSGLLTVAGGAIRLNILHLDPSTFNGEILVTGGELQLNGADYIGTSTSLGIEIDGGIVKLTNCNINTSLNSGTSPITKSGGTLNLRDSYLSAESSVNSISASTAQSVTSYGSFVDRALSTNVTVTGMITVLDTTEVSGSLKIGKINNGTAGTDSVLVQSGGVVKKISGSYYSTGGGSLAIGQAITSATSGSVLFAGASGKLSQKNSDLFYDSTNKRLGIGTNSPAFNVDVTGSGSFTTNINAGTAINQGGATQNYQLNMFGSSFAYLSMQNTASGTGGSDGFQIGYESTGTYFLGRENTPMVFFTNNASHMELASSGQLKLTAYVPLAFTGTTASYPTFDAAGNLIQSSTNVATSVPFNGITAATGTNNPDHGSFQQIHNWNSLAGTPGAFYLRAITTAAAANTQALFAVDLQGANATSTQTTKAAYVYNTHTGTSSTNIGLDLRASGGTNNYALTIGSGNGSIGIGTSTPVASALVEVASTTQGFLPPRMTTTQMNAISSPATGLQLFNTTSGAYYTYDGTAYKSTGVVSGSFSQVGTATTVFTVTFGGTQPNTTYKVNITPTAALSAALFYVTNKTTTTFDVTYLAGLTGTVTFDYTLTQ